MMAYPGDTSNRFGLGVYSVGTFGSSSFSQFGPQFLGNEGQCRQADGVIDYALLSLPYTGPQSYNPPQQWCNNTRNTIGCRYPSNPLGVGQQPGLILNEPNYGMNINHAEYLRELCTYACDIDDEAAYWMIYSRLWILHRAYWYVRALEPLGPVIFLFFHLVFAGLALILNSVATCLAPWRPSLMKGRVHILSLLIANIFASLIAIGGNNIVPFMTLSANFTDLEIYSEDIERCHVMVERDFGRMYMHFNEYRDLYTAFGQTRRYAGPSHHVHFVTFLEHANLALVLVSLFSLIAYARYHYNAAVGKRITSLRISVQTFGIWLGSTILAAVYFLPTSIFWSAYTEFRPFHIDLYPQTILLPGLVKSIRDEFQGGHLAATIAAFYKYNMIGQIIFEAFFVGLLVVVFLWTYWRLRLKQNPYDAVQARIAANALAQVRNGRAVALLLLAASILPLFIYLSMVYYKGLYLVREKSVSREHIFPPYVGMYVRLANVFYLLLTPILLMLFSWGQSHWYDPEAAETVIISPSPKLSLISERGQQTPTFGQGRLAHAESYGGSWGSLDEPQPPPLSTKKASQSQSWLAPQESPVHKSPSEPRIPLVGLYSEEPKKKPPILPQKQIPLRTMGRGDDTPPEARRGLMHDTWLMDPKPISLKNGTSSSEDYRPAKKVPPAVPPKRTPLPEQWPSSEAPTLPLPPKKPILVDRCRSPAPKLDPWRSSPNLGEEDEDAPRQKRSADPLLDSPWWMAGADALLPPKSRKPLMEPSAWIHSPEQPKRSKSVATLV